jgi:sigma-B regulation protein RsbU (phosphoserine phosphatase)
MRLQFLFNGIFFLVLSLGLAYFIAEKIARPLRRLTGVTKAIAAGDFGAQASVKRGAKEVRILADSVDEMSSKIVYLMDEQREKGRMAAELTTAQLVQKTLLPPATFAIPGADIQAFAVNASECGGDIWGLQRLSPTRTLLYMLYIGDATGHGVAAAFATVAARAAQSQLRQVLKPDGRPTEILGDFLAAMNRAVFEVTSGSIWMTMFAMLFDSAANEIAYYNCGHINPFIMPHGGGKIRGLGGGGMPLGVAGDYSIKHAMALELRPHDRLLLFTDGIIENARAGQKPLGRGGLKQILDRAAKGEWHVLHKELVAACDDIARAPLADDMTFVMVEMAQAARAAKPAEKAS